MTMEDIITGIFCRVDDKIGKEERSWEQSLAVSEVVTIGMMFAMKGIKFRPFYTWLSSNFRSYFPALPSRRRLQELLRTHAQYADDFLGDPSFFSVADSYGVELLHPKREGRSDKQIGKKGVSNHRWIIGHKVAVLANDSGEIVDWQHQTANVSDNTFLEMIRAYEKDVIVLVDGGFHSKDNDPDNLKICRKGEWNCRMLIETIFSMLTSTCGFKRLFHRTTKHLHAHLAYLFAAFNIMISWNTNNTQQHFKPLSIKDFVLWSSSSAH